MKDVVFKLMCCDQFYYLCYFLKKISHALPLQVWKSASFFLIKNKKNR
jgi:hypothetical protein